MKKNLSVERDILFYALRYSIGRKTFAPTIVIDNIKHNIDMLDRNDLQMIIREVEERRSFGYGMDCDKAKWEGFMEYLKKEIEKK